MAILSKEVLAKGGSKLFLCLYSLNIKPGGFLKPAVAVPYRSIDHSIDRSIDSTFDLVCFTGWSSDNERIILPLSYPLHFDNSKTVPNITTIYPIIYNCSCTWFWCFLDDVLLSDICLQKGSNSEAQFRCLPFFRFPSFSSLTLVPDFLPFHALW